jgi:hypothetical protein
MRGVAPPPTERAAVVADRFVAGAQHVGEADLVGPAGEAEAATMTLACEDESRDDEPAHDLRQVGRRDPGLAGQVGRGEAHALPGGGQGADRAHRVLGGLGQQHRGIQAVTGISPAS